MENQHAEKLHKSPPTLRNYSCKYCNFAKKLQEKPADYTNKAQKYHSMHSNCVHEDRKLYDFHCDCSNKDNKKQAENFTVKNLPFFFADSFRNDEIYLSPQKDKETEKDKINSNSKTKKISYNIDHEQEQNVNIMTDKDEDIEKRSLDQNMIKDHLISVNKFLSNIGKRKIIEFNENRSLLDIIKFNDFLMDAIEKDFANSSSQERNIKKLGDIAREYTVSDRYDRGIQTDKFLDKNTKHYFSEGAEPDECHDLRNKLENILNSDLNNLNELKHKFDQLIFEIDHKTTKVPSNYEQYNLESDKKINEIADGYEQKIDELEKLNETLREKLIEQNRYVDISAYEDKIRELNEQNKQLHDIIKDMNAEDESISENYTDRSHMMEKTRQALEHPIDTQCTSPPVKETELHTIIEELSLIILSKENYESIDTKRFEALKNILGENNLNIMMSHAKEKENFLNTINDMRIMVTEQADVTIQILDKLKAYLVLIRDSVQWKNTDVNNQTRTRLLLLIDLAQNEIFNHENLKASIERLAYQYNTEKQIHDNQESSNDIKEEASPNHISLLKKESELTFKNFNNKFSNKKLKYAESKFAPKVDECDIGKRELSVEPVKLDENKTNRIRPVSSYDSLTEKDKNGIEKRELMNDFGKLFYASTIALDRSTVS